MFIEMITAQRNQYKNDPSLAVQYYATLAQEMARLAKNQATAVQRHYYDSAHCTKFTVYGGCDRQSVFRLQNVPQSDPADAHGQGVFIVGNAYEAILNAAMICAGFKISYSGGTIENKVSVRPDAILTIQDAHEATLFEQHFGVEPSLSMVVEYKSMHSRSFKAIEENGLQADKPHYYMQMQLQMVATNTPMGLFLAVNKNTGALYQEIIHKDKHAIAEELDRIQRLFKVHLPTECHRGHVAVPVTTFVRGKNNRPEPGTPYTEKYNKKGHLYGFEVELPTKKLPTECKYCPYHTLCWNDYDLRQDGRDITLAPLMDDLNDIAF